jgi:dethiobiotin synthetase
MKRSGFFVTGTDTGIGKTVVSTTLSVGLKANYWKPIQTGSREGTDSGFLRQWIGNDRIWPEAYVFSDPVSPHVAAEGERQTIELSQILDEYQKISGTVIVEGAGGLLVPIGVDTLMIDLILKLELPVILVTSLRLGMINHTLLSLEALRARSIPIAGWISVGDENRSTQRSIESYGSALHLGHIPNCTSFTHSWFQTSFQKLSLLDLVKEGSHV